MKRITRLLILTLIMVLQAMPAVALQLEVQYPPFGGVSPGGGPASWVRYIFLLALALTSIAAVGSLIYAGIVWMTSASSERVGEAKKRIWASVTGIVLVAGSVVILRTINPDLVSLRTPSIQKFIADPDRLADLCTPTQYFSIEDGACRDKKDIGANCSFNAECKSNNCQEEGDKRICIDAPAGRECTSHNQCPVDQYCNFDTERCVPSLSGPSNVGKDCSGNPRLCGGDLYCNLVNNKCEEKLTGGSKCTPTRDEMCQSGECRQGGTGVWACTWP